MTSNPFELVESKHESMLLLAEQVRQAQSEQEVLGAIRRFSEIYPASWHRNVKDRLQALVSQSFQDTKDLRLVSGPLSVVEALLENTNTPMEVIFSYSLLQWYPERVSHHPLVPLWITTGSPEIFQSLRVAYDPQKLMSTLVLKKSIETNEGIGWIVGKFLELGAPEIIGHYPKIQKKNKRGNDFSKQDILAWKKEVRKFYEETLSSSDAYLAYCKESHSTHFHPAVPLERFVKLGQPQKVSASSASNPFLVNIEEILNLMSVPYRMADTFENLGEVSRKVNFFRELANLFGEPFNLHPLAAILEDDYELKYQAWFQETEGLPFLLRGIPRKNIFQLSWHLAKSLKPPRMLICSKSGIARRETRFVLRFSEIPISP